MDSFIGDVRHLPTTLRNALSVASIWQATGGVFALLAVIFSMTHVLRHILFNQSVIRKCTVRILLMVPIYSIDSAVCLLLENTGWKWAEPLSLIREAYEAIALLSFMQFVLTVKGGALQIAEDLTSSTADGSKHRKNVEHMPPLRWVVHMPPVSWIVRRDRYIQGEHFLAHMLMGIAQYAVVMILVFVLNTLIWSLTNAGIVQDDGLIQRVLTGGIGMFKACSNAWALYCLVLFAHTASSIFPKARFGCKILAIKGIVFFTFWQEKIIAVLEKAGILHKLLASLDALAVKLDIGTLGWASGRFQSGLNDFLLCIETFVFCFIHFCAYLPREWEDRPDVPLFGNPSSFTDPTRFVLPWDAFYGHVVEIRAIFGDIFRLRDQAIGKGVSLAMFDFPLSPSTKSLKNESAVKSLLR